MTNHVQHAAHDHTHGPGCGHAAITHENHVDYAHDGHLHNLHLGHVDEHVLAVSKVNPDGCTPGHACGSHTASHAHGADCGHARVPHGDHVDYLVAGHLHAAHDGHCDDHGPVTAA